MDRSELTRASKLLQKAESTSSDHEAVALAAGAYRLLAGAITAYDEAHADALPPGTPRRERRLLPDRRAAQRSEAAPETPSENVIADARAAFAAIPARPSRPSFSLKL